MLRRVVLSVRYFSSSLINGTVASLAGSRPVEGYVGMAFDEPRHPKSWPHCLWPTASQLPRWNRRDARAVLFKRYAENGIGYRDVQLLPIAFRLLFRAKMGVRLARCSFNRISNFSSFLPVYSRVYGFFLLQVSGVYFPGF